MAFGRPRSTVAQQFAARAFKEIDICSTLRASTEAVDHLEGPLAASCSPRGLLDGAPGG